VPSFDAKARRMLLDSGQLDWADINPDIFGSMIQGVAAPETKHAKWGCITPRYQIS
jgi:hypothetical protein